MVVLKIIKFYNNRGNDSSLGQDVVVEDNSRYRMLSLSVILKLL